MPGEIQRPGLWMTLEDRAAIFENFSNFLKKHYLLTKKIHFIFLLPIVFSPTTRRRQCNTLADQKIGY
jgi:hypothetical protein